MAYTYISTNKNEYVLIEAGVKLKGGQKTNVYYFVSPDSEAVKKHKLAERMPEGYEVKEITRNGFPLVHKINH